MRILKLIAGLFILFWMAIVDVFLVVYAIWGDAYPAVVLLIGIWLGYLQSDWITKVWDKINRKFDEWADV
jgi:hypothetical protein